MKSKSIIPGITDFNEIINKKLHVVDKTLFITEFMNCDADVCTILRPRRFGKSTNLSMLNSFLSLGADPSKFDHFEIGKPEHRSFVEEHCGRYPVVYLDFKDHSAKTWKEMSALIIQAIKLSLDPHEAVLSKHDPHDLKKLQNTSFKLRDFTSVLLHLSMTLSEIHKTEVIVLIDEYDAPLNEAYKMDFDEKALRFFEKFLSRGLKKNEHLKKACLMGTAEVCGAGLFSDFKNTAICPVTDKKFASSFGFTRDEVLKFLNAENSKSDSGTSDNECERELENLLEWYNGYTMGNCRSVINPWSLVSWLRRSKEFGPYWVDNLSSQTLSSLIKRCIPSRLEELTNLLLGDKPVYAFTLRSAVNFSLDRIFHLLIYAGYLSYKPLSKKKLIELSIPNKELKLHWKVEFINLFSRTTDYSKIKDVLYQIITATPVKVKLVEKFLRKYFVISLSQLDSMNENSNHVALNSFFRVLFLDHDDLTFSSNKEAGHEISDVLFEIRSIKRVVCIKLNYTKHPNSLEAKAESALQRIKDKNYAADYGHCECILIGVSFSGKLMSNLVSEIVPSVKRQCVEE